MISITASLSLAAGGVALAPPATAAPPDRELKHKLASVMDDPRVAEADSAAAVLDPRKKKELYSRHGADALTPASNTKILTAAAAMNKLGPDYRFKTEVITNGRISPKGTTKNLYLKGYGDPTSMESDYADLAEQVKASGIKHVTGHLVVDDSFYDDDYYHDTWAPSDRSEYYAAQISALTVSPNTDYDAGTIIVTYSPGDEGEPAEYSITPEAAEDYVTIENETTTVEEGTENTFDFERAEGTNTITLSGDVPVDTDPTKKWVAVHHPQLYAGTVFADELEKVGVTVDRSTVERETPARRTKVVATDHSIKLSELLTPFLKLSNNSHGEHLTKAMSARKGHPGNWEDGTKYLERYARSSRGSAAGVNFVDGSGLSHDNKISPRTLVRVLDKIRHEPWFPVFEDALPLAGNPDRMVGGSLSDRMRGTAAENNARGKTGSLTGVTALSGYVRGEDGRLYIFSMLSEYEDESPRPVEDEFVVTLAEHSR
ncbi:MAG: D-alanyl-D-alanine carboxypeptidase/D-alanyl-D-alanine endopeptidase [Propionibacteriaceae bacterium]